MPTAAKLVADKRTRHALTTVNRRHMIGGLLAVMTFDLATTARGNTLTQTDPPLVSFAHDISSGDAALIDRVRGLIAAPPTTLETIGFYGAESAPARTRAWLATVSELNNRGFVQSSEDKYCHELFDVWATRSWIDRNTLPKAAELLVEIAEMDDEDDFDDPAEFRERLWKGFAAAGLAIETALAAQGRVVISLDASDGDTMFYAATTPEIAARWINTAFSPPLGTYQGGVRAFMWDRYWDHLTYALSNDDTDNTTGNGYPPGTRLRAAALAMSPN